MKAANGNMAGEPRKIVKDDFRLVSLFYFVKGFLHINPPATMLASGINTLRYSLHDWLLAFRTKEDRTRLNLLPKIIVGNVCFVTRIEH